MAYSTGTAATFSAMRTALTDACVADGWTWDAVNEVVWKGTIFAKLTIETGAYGDGLALLGRTSLTAGDGPTFVQIGPALRVPVAFPVTYHIFTFTNEVLLVVNYSGKYQWLTFGASQQAGLIGSGNYYAASLGHLIPAYVYIDLPNPYASMALFWSTAVYNDTVKTPNCFIDSNIDLGGWSIVAGTATTGLATGVKYATELLSSQPNAYNNESILMPIKAFKPRASSKVSQTMEFENIRHIRLDNYTDEAIITLGADKWIVFPWYYKNIAERDGGGTSGTHTGTFGMAVKYEGP